MRIILQRVSRASVRVDGATVGSIQEGALLLVGIESADGRDEIVRAAAKVAELRIFPDTEGRMNLSLLEVQGECLVVSQFTLAATLSKGRRPSFDGAARPGVARELFKEFCDQLRAKGIGVSTGVFGAHMEVELVNDGPVTFVIDFRD